jgi:hypothetical protein
MSKLFEQYANKFQNKECDFIGWHSLSRAPS